MVVGEASIHNIMGGMESTGGVRLHNHKRKLKQRFDIIKKLGQGTYGKVQLGINKETGQEVAIKTIKKCKIETEADLIRIRREIQIMSSVQHPNIIHIYEVFENREKMVLVMEYAAGGELYDYLSERKVLSEQEARRIFRQIATAVFYCHKHKICHRDLKLENILLDQVGNAKIADFGLSNVFDEQRLLSTFCGSPLYASPEIVKGTPYHGPEVDCWSLGVLLYTLVYGAMPFDGSNFKRLVKQISQSDYFEPKKPSPASPLIKDMLTVCPARRADIEKICTHWWVNEGYEQNCLDIAEELAAQTPVRLDLLLSLVPQSASAEKLLVGDQQASGDVGNNMSSETLVPTRCHSVGSLMDLEQNSSDRRIRDLYDEEPRSIASCEAKRKLETTPSMDETAAAGVKRKERSRRKERSDEREPRAYRSTSRHHSAPIPNSITEEAMEVDHTATVPTTKTVDMDKIEASAACLELIEESKERSASKERSKTPVAMEGVQLSEETAAKVEEDRGPGKEEDVQESSPKSEEKTNALADKSSSQQNDISNTPKDSANTEVGYAQNLNKVDSMKEIKKLKEKALSLDSELEAEAPAKPTERRRSKIFETAERFNQMATSTESEKPKKIFIPGVNVGGAKRVFERKASLSSITTPPVPKASASKVIIDVPVDKKSEKPDEKKELNADEKNKKDEAKKRAVDIITGAIGKPPVQRKVNGSPPISPQTHDPKKMGLKIQVAPNDVRNATVSVSTPVETKFPFEGKAGTQEATMSSATDTNSESSQAEEPKVSSKMEITLKSATLPRPRKTSKAEIMLSGVKSPEPAFKSEVEAKIDAFQPQKLRTQRSEVAFPVAAAAPHTTRSASLEPETKPKTTPRERIIPIQVESGHQPAQSQSTRSSTPPPKPPMPQRSASQRSGSLSRQSTADSDTDSALGSTIGPEPIRKSPREYIIPIAVEGGGYVTPRSGSLEPESKTSTPTSTNPPRSRFSRPRRMSSLLSDASEDESPFSSLHRDSEDLLQRHMHRLRSSRPSRQAPEHADSLSSGEDDDDDGFELLTAENLFSTLLSRVRSLTQRLNVDDNRSTGFPSSRLLGRLGSNSSQAFWGLNKPLSRRLSESQFKHSLSRDADLFSRKDSTGSNPGTPNSSGSHTPLRESVFEIGSNTLPRDKVEHEDIEAETQIKKEAQESLEQNFTPSLARRLSRQFIEQTRQSLPRSPSIPRDRLYRSPTRDPLSSTDADDDSKRTCDSATSDQTEYRRRSVERNVRRANSLLEPGTKVDKTDRSPRRSISLFEDDDRLLPPLPRQVMTLGRKYKDSKPNPTIRRENFYPYRTEKIQEESIDDASSQNIDNTDFIENGSTSECTSVSMCNSNANIMDTTSSVSVRSYETSSTESTSNTDYGKSYAADMSKNFENRLLAAENLIKESKLKNLGPKFNPNLCSSYKDTEKCDKESLASISDGVVSKRRSCIPSLRLRSGSLTREPSATSDRRRSFCGSQDTLASRALSPEKSLLSKFFKTGNKDSESKEKAPKSKQHRISRFLRPDFFDTPREESQYVKEKEAQKAAENERRKSRFMKRKSEQKVAQQDNTLEEKPDKELKNEMNSMKKDNPTGADGSFKREDEKDNSKLKVERQNSKSSFLHSLEKKIEKFRANDETEKGAVKAVANGNIPEQKGRNLRENSAPPSDCLESKTNTVKRATSVENLAPKNSSPSTSKSRVSMMFGLFKNSDAKQAANGTRSQNAILSKLKKSPPKSVKSDASLSEDSSSASRIPTKAVRADPKSLKKATENKKSPEKSLVDSKRSPSKEKEKIKETKEKKVSEKAGKEQKKLERSSLSETSSSFTESSVSKEKSTKTESAAQVDAAKSSDNSESSLRRDNKQVEAGEKVEDKKLIKTKKNISSLKKSDSVSKADSSSDSAKKIKKPVRVKTADNNEEPDAAKKKKIVRVVKKVVKKTSETPDNKSEGKEKLKKTVQKSVSSKKEDSPEVAGTNATNKSKESNSNNESKAAIPVEAAQNSSGTAVAEITAQSSKSDVSESNLNAAQSKSVQQRANRSNLRLDLSKIPQHAFRNTTPKRDSPKQETGKTNASSSPKIDGENAELMQTLSKITHHANITGNKIIIDKPLRAKDVAELKKEVTECARIIENHMEQQNEQAESENTEPVCQIKEEIPKEALETSEKLDHFDESPKEPQHSQTDYISDVFSPEEPESFDSWSICSADLNHTRGDLHSPTSPSYSLYIGGDHSESVIDRIRRRSFYSRFNDRKRPSLTAPPPGVSLPSGSTLYRKLSLNSLKDRDRKWSGYSSKRQDRYNIHNDSLSSYRRSPVGKERYTDVSSTSPCNTEVRSPVEHYGSLSSSCDPLRRYIRSPTFDVSNSRVRYYSTDLSDSEIGSYKNLLSSSFNENAMPSYTSRGYGTLPRKFGSTLSNTEPKTVEYYEELLAPSNPDYLTMRRSTLSNEHIGRCENGYSNGSMDSQYGADKRRSHATKISSEFIDVGDEQIGDRKRSLSQCIGEPKDLPSTSSETQSNTCTAK